MNQCSELARIAGFGNVYRTSCGIISINVRGVTLHLEEDAFTDFSSMITNASSVLLNRKLAEFIKENED